MQLWAGVGNAAEPFRMPELARRSQCRIELARHVQLNQLIAMRTSGLQGGSKLSHFEMRGVAGALHVLGVQPWQRVATLMWKHTSQFR